MPALRLKNLCRFNVASKENPSVRSAVVKRHVWGNEESRSEAGIVFCNFLF